MLHRVSSAVNNWFRRRGYEVRRVDPRSHYERVVVPMRLYTERALAIDVRHHGQTLEDVIALRDRYAAPVFGRVRVWDLIQRLGTIVDPTDQALFCTSQLTHVLQVLEGMERDGIDDPDLVLAALIHDLGKLLLATDEDPANVVSLNRPIGEYECGVGLDHTVMEWNHDEFGYSRFKDHVPDHVAWLIRYHSIDIDECRGLMDARDRDYTDRYLRVFSRYDHGTKSPYRLPSRPIEDYREVVERAFPEPVLF